MMNRITIEDIGRACAAEVAEKDRMSAQITNLASKLRKLNLILARETRVDAEIEIYTDWEMPEMAIDAIAGAKKQLARDLADEIIERDLFEMVIDENRPYRRLRAEIRVLRPEKRRETV